MERILVSMMYVKDGQPYADMDLSVPLALDLQQAASLQEQLGADALLLFDYSYDKVSQEKALADIRAVCDESDIPVWVGGNILCTKDAANYFAAGASVVVLDEERMSNVDMMEALARQFGADHLALHHVPGGIDALSEAAADRIAYVIAPQLPENAPGSLNCIIYREEADKEQAEELLQKRNVSGIGLRMRTDKNDSFWRMKMRLKEDGIAVRTLTPAMPFTEFKVNKDGLIPCIVQDVKTGDVLMLAYMNEESFHITCDTGLATYYSRSRHTLWTKGMTSGHLQFVRRMYIDCDSDTLLLKVRQIGGACHTGHRTCFYRTLLES